MMLMAEGDGLGPNDSLTREVGRFLDAVCQPSQTCGDEQKAEDARAGESVKRGMEDLRHAVETNLGALFRVGNT